MRKPTALAAAVVMAASLGTGTALAAASTNHAGTVTAAVGSRNPENTPDASKTHESARAERERSADSSRETRAAHHEHANRSDARSSHDTATRPDTERSRR